MKPNPYISTPVVLGLLAVGASQVFNLVASFAIDREQIAVDQPLAIVETAVIEDPVEPEQPGVGRTISLRELRILDPEGNTVIRLGGNTSGGMIEMLTQDGARVLVMLCDKDGDYYHAVMGGVIPAFLFNAVSREKHTFLSVASPCGRSAMGLRMRPDDARFSWSSPLATDDRFAISGVYSLTGGFYEMRDLPPGHLLSYVHGPRGTVPLGDHSLYTFEELHEAIEEAATANPGPQETDVDLLPDPTFPMNREDNQ